MRFHNRLAKVLVYIIVIVFIPSAASAHGNPLLVLSLIPIALAQVGLALYLGLRKRLLPPVAIYLMVLFLTWSWALNYRGPDFKGMYIGLVVVPLCIFLIILWAVRK